MADSGAFPRNAMMRPKQKGKFMSKQDSKAPSHIAYQVRDRDGKKGFFTKIGAAWPNSDGRGYNIQLDVVPLDGRITLRVATEKKE
jgi:hypothetical protein